MAAASPDTSWAGHRQPVVFSQRERVSPNTLAINTSPQLAQSLPGGRNVTKTGRPFPLLTRVPWDTHPSVSAVTADSVEPGSSSLVLWKALPECDNEQSPSGA